MASQVNASLPKLFIGLDIHKRTWKIHFCTDLFDGSTVSFAPNASALQNYVEKHYPNHSIHVAYESGCCGYSAARAFHGYGWQVKVVNPADIPRPAKQGVIKTDKIDCINIARQLRSGNLWGIHIPSVEQEQIRCIFRRRFDLVKDFRRIKSRIKSTLLFHGIEVPTAFDNPNWSHAFINWLIDLEWENGMGQANMDSLIFHYRFLDKEIKAVSKTMKAYCRKHYKKDYYLLRSVPGIGPLTAAAFLCELGDLRRFSSAKKFASYIGLVPGVHQSGDTMRMQGITPRGHRTLRSYIVEAAWIAVRRDPALQAYYRSHVGKNTKAVIIKVAHKLLNRLLSVIKKEIPYEIGVVR
ncbi:MAG: IS110 family transposase [Bacteroidota bacterium]